MTIKDWNELSVEQLCRLADEGYVFTTNDGRIIWACEE